LIFSRVLLSLDIQPTRLLIHYCWKNLVS
jgi:hypothetical protein